MPTTLAEFSQQLANTVENSGKSVVSILEGGRTGVSGTVWREGIGVAVNHTIHGLEEVTVILPSGKETKASVAGRDPGTDIAILKLPIDIPAAALSDDSSARTGEIVLSVGRRGTDGLAATYGLISAIGGPWRTSSGGRTDHWFRLDLNPFAARVNSCPAKNIRLGRAHWQSERNYTKIRKGFRSRTDSDSFAHGDVFGELVEFLAVGGAFGFFGGEGLETSDVGAELVFQFFNAGGEGNERVGERIFHVMRVGDEDALPVAVNDVGGHADDGGVGRHVRENHGAGADAGVLADGDVAEHVGVVPYKDAIAECGVALAVPLAGAAERDALVESDVAADDGGFADDNAGGVIDEEAAAEQRTGMDVDAGEEAGEPRKNTCGQAQLHLPEPVRNAVIPDGPQARIAEHELKPGARCWVAFED